MAQDFTAQWERARSAAHTAGDAWVAAHTKPAYVVTDDHTGKAVGTMLDLCGRAYVQTKGNTAFGKWVKRTYPRSSKWLHFCLAHEMRQEIGLHEAMARAALSSLCADGIGGLSLYTWID